MLLVMHFLLICGVWMWMLASFGPKAAVNGSGFGSDFAMFWSAAHVQTAGGNFYDPQVLYRTEHTLLTREGETVFEPRTLIRVGNPPFFFTALRPLATLPFRTAALLWIAAMYALFAIAGFGLMRGLGWRRYSFPLVVFLVTPQVLLGALYGNAQAVVFAVLVAGLLVAKRYPVAAGALMALALVKPQVGIPGALLVMLLYPNWAPRMCSAFVAASGALLVGAGLPALMHWVHSLYGYSSDLATQPNLASLSGLYAPFLPTTWRTTVSGLAIVLALVATFITWWRGRKAERMELAALGWLWFVWFARLERSTRNRMRFASACRISR